MASIEDDDLAQLRLRKKMGLQNYESAISGKWWADKLIGDRAPEAGDDAIQPSWDLMDVLPQEKIAALAAGLAKTKALPALGMAMGAIRKTPTGKVLGTVSKEAMELGPSAAQSDLASQAMQELDIPSYRAQEMVSPIKESLSANTQGGALERLKERYDDPEMSLAIDRLHQKAVKKNQPYEVLKNKGAISGIIPNFEAVPTGTIGSPKFEKIMQKDPFQWADSKYGATKSLLKKHSDAKIPVTIHTSSDLVGRDDYIDLIPEGSKINLYLPRGRHLDPGHPSAQRLLDAAERLKERGVNVEIHPPEFSFTKPEIKRVGSKEAAGDMIWQLRQKWYKFKQTGQWEKTPF